MNLLGAQSNNLKRRLGLSRAQGVHERFDNRTTKAISKRWLIERDRHRSHALIFFDGKQGVIRHPPSS
jgi:hypothetical protein